MDTRWVAGLLCLCALWWPSSSQSCEETHAERCLKKLLQFTDRPELDFADSPPHLHTECVEAQTASACLSRYSKKCLSAEERPAYAVTISGPQALAEALCSEGSDIRAKYLRNLPCLRNMSDGFRYCKDKYERNQRDIAAVEYEDKVHLLCCSHEGYRRCLRILSSAQNSCSASEPIGDVIDEIIVTRALSTDACADQMERCMGSGSSRVSKEMLAFLPLLLAFILL